MNGPKGLIYVFTGDGKGKTSAALGCAVRAACAGKRVAIVQWYKTSGKREAESGKLKQQNTIRPSWVIAEHNLPDFFPNLEIYPMGAGFHLLHASRLSAMSSRSNDFTLHASVKTAPLRGGGVVVDTASEEVHRKAAQEALQLAKELLTSDSGFPLSRVARRSIQKDGDQAFVGSLNDHPAFREALGIQKSKNLDGQFPRKGDPSSPLFLLVLDEVINAVNDHLLALPDLLGLLALRGPTHLILTGRGASKKLIKVADLVTEMKNVKHPYEIGKKAIKGLDY